MGYHCDIYCENGHFIGHFDDIHPQWYPKSCNSCDTNRFADLSCQDDMCNQVQKDDVNLDQNSPVEDWYKPIPKREDGSFDLSDLNLTFRTAEEVYTSYQLYFEDMMEQMQEMGADIKISGGAFVATIEGSK